MPIGFLLFFNGIGALEHWTGRGKCHKQRITEGDLIYLAEKLLLAGFSAVTVEATG
jgi:hypothetical protein